MRTLTRLALVPATVALLLTACGSKDEAKPAATTAPVSTTAAPASTVAGTTAAGTTAGGPATTAGPATTEAEQPGGGDVAEIDVKVGVNDSPSRVENVALNQPVVITIQSDSDEEYHLHGYELEKKAAAGTEVSFSFNATMPGDFELESHTTDQVLLVLHVS